MIPGEVWQIRDPTTGEGKPYVFTGYLGGLEVWEELATGFRIKLTRIQRERLAFSRIRGPPLPP